MTDRHILDLFCRRDPKALDAISDKYKGVCLGMARRFVPTAQDGEECFNDTLLALWKQIHLVLGEDVYNWVIP